VELLILSSRLSSLGEEAISEIEVNGDRIHIYRWEELSECPLLYDSDVIVLDLGIDTTIVNDRFFSDNFHDARIARETRLALTNGRSMIVLAAATVRQRWLERDNYGWLTRFFKVGVSGDSYGVNYSLVSEKEVYGCYFEGVSSYYKTFSPTVEWADEHNVETLAVADGTQLPIAIECTAGRGRVVFLPPTEKAPEEAVADLYAIAKYEDERARAAAEPVAEVEAIGPTEAQEAVRSVAEGVEQVRADVQFIGGINRNVAVELETLVTQVEAQRAAASAKIIDGDDAGIEEVRGILVALQGARLDSYKTCGEVLVREARRRLEHPLWPGNRVSIVEKLDETESRLGVLNSETSTAEVDATSLIEGYRREIDSVARILDRMRSEAGRARYLTPLKVLAWGLPIVIGLWFSYAPSLVKQGSLVGLVVLAGISYLLVGSPLIQRLSASRLVVGGTVFVILVLGGVVGYLQRVALLSMLQQLRIGDVGVVVGVGIAIVVLTLVSSLPEIMREVGRSRLHVRATMPGKRFAPDSDIDVHFSLTNRSSTVLTDVTLRVVAPGLMVPDETEPVFKAIGARDTKEYAVLLGIPTDAPEGEYALEFEWRFWRGTRRLERTTRLSIRVVS